MEDVCRALIASLVLAEEGDARDPATCMRCGMSIKSFSPMRKWCYDCRKKVTMEQAKARKQGKR